ncbi:MAG: HEAT repeat domain-containing protein [Limnothrix sp. RL_2_0]|nr:HEAT repeat domain-containing protein [Limnothrix sp. RL_2_0]
MNSIQELRRKGLPPIELWNVVLNSKKLQEEYQHQYPKIDLKRAKKLVSLCSQLKSVKKFREICRVRRTSRKMKSSESIPALLESLKDADIAVKETALNALFHIGGEEVITGLEAVEKDDSFFYEGVKLLLRELKNEKVLPSVEFFEKQFFGHSWRIIEEDELLYKRRSYLRIREKKTSLFLL